MNIKLLVLIMIVFGLSGLMGTALANSASIAHLCPAYVTSLTSIKNAKVSESPQPISNVPNAQFEKLKKQHDKSGYYRVGVVYVDATSAPPALSCSYINFDTKKIATFLFAYKLKSTVDWSVVQTKNSITAGQVKLRTCSKSSCFDQLAEEIILNKAPTILTHKYAMPSVEKNTRLLDAANDMVAKLSTQIGNWLSSGTLTSAQQQALMPMYETLGDLAGSVTQDSFGNAKYWNKFLQQYKDLKDNKHTQKFYEKLRTTIKQIKSDVGL